MVQFVLHKVSWRNFSTRVSVFKMSRARANTGGPQIDNPTPVEGSLENGNPTPVPNSPAKRVPKSYHITTDYPLWISPAFRYFREFWCGAFEGREQRVCRLGNKYRDLRAFSGELQCEKSMLLPHLHTALPNFASPSKIIWIRWLNLVFCRAMGSWRRYRDDRTFGYALSALLPRTKVFLFLRWLLRKNPPLPFRYTKNTQHDSLPSTPACNKLTRKKRIYTEASNATPTVYQLMEYSYNKWAITIMSAFSTF